MKIQSMKKCPNALGPLDSEIYNQFEIFWKEENRKTIVVYMDTSTMRDHPLCKK